MPLLSMRQYAKHRGVSAMAVSKAVAASRIALIDGKIDPEAADVAWTRNTRVNLNEHQKPRETAPPPRPPDQPELEQPPDDAPLPNSLADAQRRKELAIARRRELEVDLLEGKLVDVDDAVREWGRMISSTRASALLMPDKLAPKLAPVSDVRDCRALIEAAVKEMLSGLVEYRPHAE